MEILNEPKRKRQRIDSDLNQLSQTQTHSISTSTVNAIALSTSKTKETLNQILNDIEEPIEVSVGGNAKRIPLIPLLHVSDIGLIPLPLNDCTIALLLQKMKSSSFGRHLSTETDESVRKSYELTADQFECKNPKFNAAVQILAKTASKTLGIHNEHVVAVPYKLILYEPGSHFVEHRDTEKLEGMFGTLVVQLPSIYMVENGLPVLSVKHLENEYEYHFGAEENCDAPLSATNIFYAANYADLRHTVNKIESGHRLILTYNLTVSRGKQPRIPSYDNLHGELGCTLNQWNDDKPMVLRLEHLYTEQSLDDSGMEALKGEFFVHSNDVIFSDFMFLASTY